MMWGIVLMYVAGRCVDGDVLIRRRQVHCALKFNFEGRREREALAQSVCARK